MAVDGPLKPSAKQHTGDDSRATGGPRPRRHGLRRQGRKDGMRGRLYL
ncbi:hypothetical protein HrrHm1_305 [Halorubrum virus Humcor1]|nr:hypothetical protein HrrHm1_305 [Halorubrum virus Humcor1]